MNRHKLTIAAAAALATFGSGNAFAQGNSATVSATSSTTIATPITISAVNELNFYSLTKSTIPGIDIVKVDANNGCNKSVVAGGTGNTRLIGTSKKCAWLKISGQAGQTFTVSVPAAGTQNLSNGTTNLPLTFNFWPPSPATLDGTGNLDLYIGGQFPISDTATTGAYTASFNVTVAYQ